MELFILLETFGISMLIQAVFFFIAFSFQTDKVTDFSYGLSFIALLFYLLSQRSFSDLFVIVLSAMVLIWAIRLISYLFTRILKIGKDDRFDEMRSKPLKFASFWILQGISVWVIMLPVIFFMTSYSEIGSRNITFMIIGLIVWLLGISIETISDMQKFKFKNDPANKGRWVNIGLWKCSRHPNYFGEILCWWGVFVYVIPFLEGFGYLTIVGPIYITLLLLFVSGVPLIEKKYDERYKDNKEYQKYKRETNLLIPWPC